MKLAGANLMVCAVWNIFIYNIYVAFVGLVLGERDNEYRLGVSVCGVIVYELGSIEHVDNTYNYYADAWR